MVQKAIELVLRPRVKWDRVSELCHQRAMLCSSDLKRNDRKRSGIILFIAVAKTKL
jgi:hypothetical protein